MLDRILTVGAIAHLAVGIACAVWLAFDANALKPAKFGFSIALFLATMAILVPRLDASSAVRATIAWGLVATNAIEIVLIVMQAARGTASHFNIATTFDAAVWRTMATSVVVMVVFIGAVVVLATFRDVALPPAMRLGFRIALWMFVAVAVSGFAMAGRGSHTVGGRDLRWLHFVGMHALQALPVVGYVTSSVGLVLAAAVGWGAAILLAVA